MPFSLPRCRATLSSPGSPQATQSRRSSGPLSQTMRAGRSSPAEAVLGGQGKGMGQRPSGMPMLSLVVGQHKEHNHLMVDKETLRPCLVYQKNTNYLNFFYVHTIPPFPLSYRTHFLEVSYNIFLDLQYFFPNLNSP